MTKEEFKELENKCLKNFIEDYCGTGTFESRNYWYGYETSFRRSLDPLREILIEKD